MSMTSQSAQVEPDQFNAGARLGFPPMGGIGDQSAPQSTGTPAKMENEVPVEMYPSPGNRSSRNRRRESSSGNEG
jgi:hypothetical protein